MNDRKKWENQSTNDRKMGKISYFHDRNMENQRLMMGKPAINDRNNRKIRTSSIKDRGHWKISY